MEVILPGAWSWTKREIFSAPHCHTDTRRGHATNPYIPGCGTVFEVNAAGVFSVLFPFHFFDGDGGGRLKASADGTIYGTTYWGGGSCRGGCGVAFKVTPNGKESVLYTFKGGSKGSLPGSIVGDSTGNLYGTTLWGGDLSCPYGAGVGCGLVFELTP